MLDEFGLRAHARYLQSSTSRNNRVVQLLQVRLTDPVVAPLVAGLTAENERRYGSVDVMADAHPHEFDAPAGAFVVLVHDDQTVAGGGIRQMLTDTCEVKRMWTSPDHRRRGHASTVRPG